AIDTNVQSLVLSASSLTFNEGSSGSFTVKLAAQPSSDVVVSVARISGSSDISVTGGANLTFTSINWNSPQTVTLSAPADSDTSNSVATIAVSAGGLPSQTVSITAIDPDKQVNAAPSVNAGADQVITLPSTAALSGTATDDNLPNPPGALTVS